MTAPTLAKLKVKLFTDGADKAQIVEMAKQSVDRRLHHQSVAAEEGRREGLRRLRPRSGRRGARPAYFVRGVFRRHPGDGGAGARHRDLGQERLRQAAGDDDARRAVVRRGARAVARRRQDQHDRDLHAPSRSPARSMRWPAARRPASRCSPAGSPISASTIGRSCRTPIARARKTRNVEIIWASTREVFNVVEADAMGCHIITAPADVLKKLPGARHQDRRPNSRSAR